MKSHKDLEVWKAAVGLAKDVYNATKAFPKEEIFGLTSQMRRCGISIASNIAEGAARQGNKEFIQYLHIALGSAAELETQLIIAVEVKLGDLQVLKDVNRNLTRVRLMLRGLVKSLNTRRAK